MLRYKVKPGSEHLVIGGDGVRNLDNGIVESDHELTSPYLEEIVQQAEQAAPVTVQPPAPQAQLPADTKAPSETQMTATPPAQPQPPANQGGISN